MKSINININQAQRKENRIEEFYDEATTDYKFWSKNYNMHFGYYHIKKESTLLKRNHAYRNESANHT